MGAAIPFPNRYFLHQGALSARWQKQYLKDETSSHVSHESFAERKSKAYWRGSLCGPDDMTNFSEYPRAMLLRIAANRSDLFDVGITGIDDSSRAISEHLERVTEDYRPVIQPPDDFAFSLRNFKFLLSLDGVTVSWRGRALLQAGGIMILQDSPMGEHFYNDLIPWIHFVPVKADLSDLVSVLEWLKANPDKAEDIALAGSRFAEEKLTDEATTCYVQRMAAAVRSATAYNLLPKEKLLEHGFEELVRPLPRRHPRP